MGGRLAALAARRGLRGFSQLINEALDRYLEDEERREAMVQEILALRGVLSAEEAGEAERRIRETRSRWR